MGRIAMLQLSTNEFLMRVINALNQQLTGYLKTETKHTVFYNILF